MIGSSALKRTGHPIDPLGNGRPGLLIQLDDFQCNLIGRLVVLMIGTRTTYGML